MVKPVRKKSKTTKSTQEDLQPLSSHSELINNANKDDEERRLESLLFGVPFVPSDVLQWGDTGGKELENIADTDVSHCECYQHKLYD
jgi:U3 small nucleolar RNA-associated protein 18